MVKKWNQILGRKKQVKYRLFYVRHLRVTFSLLINESIIVFHRLVSLTWKRFSLLSFYIYLLFYL